MRFKSYLLLGTFCLALTPNVSTARVLVPGENTSPSTGANLGLVPSESTQTQQPATLPAKPATQKQTPAPTTPQNTGKPKGVDKVDLNALNSVDIQSMKKALPADMQNMSDSDLRNLIMTQYEMAKSMEKYKRIDRDTGKEYYDIEQMQKDEANKRITNVTITPGGKLSTEKKSFSAQEQGIISSLTGKPMSHQESDLNDTILGLELQKKLNTDPIIRQDDGLAVFNDPTAKASATVAVTKDYLWGENDAVKVHYYLGYQVNEVPQQCQLRMDVIVNTNEAKDKYGATVMSGGAAQVSYNGTITGLEIRPIAVCNKPKTALPKSGGVVMEYGDKYAVKFSAATCAPASTASQPYKSSRNAVVIQYGGNSQVTCTFVR